MTMQDDTPWKPPADGGLGSGADAPGTEDLAAAIPPPPPAASSVPPPPGAADAPSLPSLPIPVVPPTPPPGAVGIEPQVPAATPGAPAAWQHDGAVPGDTIVTSSPPSRSGRSGRSKWIVGGAVASVFAVGAAGVFAVSSMTGSPQGGADTPEELGLSLLTAIENEDVLGVIDVLAPGEREVFREPMIELVSELTRLEVLSDDADLSRILGIDVELTNETVQAVSTNVPDITNIDMRADAVVSLDGAQVPIGDLITDNVPDDLMTELRGTRLTETDELDIRLTAIEEDGRWYFSAFHSIAETARADIAAGTLIPVEGIGSDGADSPEAAVDNLLARVESIDLTGLIRALNPGEAAALQRYAPLFLEEAEQELATAIASADFRWAITEQRVRFEGDGSTRTALIDALAIEGSAEGTNFSFSFADGCFRAEAEGESIEQCQSDALDAQQEILAEFPEVQKLVDTVVEAFADIEEVGLELREHEGLWYVSPTTTVSEGFLAVLRALDRSELDAIIEQAPKAGEEFAEMIFGGFDDFVGTTDVTELVGDAVSEESIIDDSIIEEPAVGTGDILVESGDDAAGASDTAGGLSGWDACYSVIDPTEATDCFNAAAESGENDITFMPVVLRFPECGYTIGWGGGYYELPDEEFTAAAEAARPCFLDLVEQGEIGSYELPNEILYLECFEGRNWYNTFDDPDYDERYFACLEEAYARD